MHVVHLETGRHLYGGAQQVLYLLDGLAREGVTNTLVCPPYSAIGTAAGRAGVQVQALPMSGDLDVGFAGRFGRWLSDHQPDLLHVHSRRGADLWGGLAARRAGIPAVLSRRVDNTDLPMLGRWKYGMYERVIAISGEIEQRLRAQVALEKLRCVHSAVDESACQPVWTREQFRDAFGLAENELAVVCVAQLIARKGHTYLLDAWSRVQAECPQARLIIFGRGAQKQNLVRQSRNLAMQNSVRFAGFRNDLLGFLGHADLLVHPALREGLGVCLLEAQAAGLPIVASRAGGIPEAVEDEVTGLLVAPAKPEALATALLRLLQDDALRARLGQAGRRNVAEKFSVPQMVSGNLGVYEEMLR